MITIGLDPALALDLDLDLVRRGCPLEEDTEANQQVSTKGLGVLVPMGTISLQEGAIFPQGGATFPQGGANFPQGGVDSPGRGVRRVISTMAWIGRATRGREVNLNGVQGQGQDQDQDRGILIGTTAACRDQDRDRDRDRGRSPPEWIGWIASSVG